MIETDRVGVIDKEIDAGVVRIASTVRIGETIRLAVETANLTALTERLGEIVRVVAPASPPRRKEPVGVMVRLREA